MLSLYDPAIPPLFTAALIGDYNEVKRLLREGVEVESVNPKTNLTALQVASSQEDSRIVQLLLDAGARVSAGKDQDSTPIGEAVRAGNLENFKLLREAGASLSGRCYGMTLLHWTASCGYEELTKVLVEAGLDVNAVDVNGETPLHAATNRGAGVEILKILLDAGANMEARSKTGDTALLSAGGYDDMVEYLLQNGADVTAASNNGMTALHLAAGKGVCKQMQLILDTKALDINAKTADGRTALHFATKQWVDEEMFLRLVEAGANINATNHYGDTALHLAAQLYSSTALKMLLDRDADVESKNNSGETPLHLAARTGSVGPINALLEAGANFEAVDKQRMTPLDHARMGRDGHFQVLRSQWEEDGMCMNDFSGEDWARIHESTAYWDEAIERLREAESQ